MSTALIVRYQINDPGSSHSQSLIEILKLAYGGGLNFIADGTLLIDTLDRPEVVFNLLSPFFSFDDKLIVAEVGDCKSLHQIPRTKPAIHKVAV